MYLQKCVNNTTTKLGSTYSRTLTDGDTIKLEVSGTTLTPYHNGTALATQDDSSLSAGYAGLYIAGAGGSFPMDDWEGGNVAAGGLSIPVAMANYRQRSN